MECSSASVSKVSAAAPPHNPPLGTGEEASARGASGPYNVGGAGKEQNFAERLRWEKNNPRGRRAHGRSLFVCSDLPDNRITHFLSPPPTGAGPARSERCDRGRPSFPSFPASLTTATTTRFLGSDVPRDSPPRFCKASGKRLHILSLHVRCLLSRVIVNPSLDSRSPDGRLGNVHFCWPCRGAGLT